MKKLLTLSLVLLFSPFLHAEPGEVQFVAVVGSVDADTGELGMLLTSDFTIPVRVTDATDIRDANEDPFTGDITVGLILRVRGLFTGDGVLAEEIRVADLEGGFAVRGIIEALSDTTVTIEGLAIAVPADAEIFDEEGNPLAFADLLVGQLVRIGGDINDGELTATKIRVRIRDEALVRISFEGIVVEVADASFLVELEAVGNVLVHITGETEINGDLTTGVLVRVVGTVEPDLSVSARKVLIQRLLQVAPRRVKVHAGQAHPAEVILRSPLDGPVEVEITSENPEIAQVEPSVVTVAAGKITAAFEVIGVASGETTVVVEVPDLGASVEVPVTVRGEQRDLELNWRPDHINMGTEQSRRVILSLNQPAPEPLEVAIRLIKGEEGGVFWSEGVMFEPGDRHVLVGVESGAIAGEFKIQAEISDGVSDDLEVTVRARSDRELDRERERDGDDADGDRRDGDDNSGPGNRDGVDDRARGDDEDKEGEGDSANDGDHDSDKEGDDSDKDGDDNSGSGGG